MIGVYLAWRGRTTAAEVAAFPGITLVLLGVIHPRLLKSPRALWWRVARMLAYVNARVLLTLMFTIVLVPLGAIWRVLGTDPLTRNRDTWPGWVPNPERYRNHKHYSRMF